MVKSVYYIDRFTDEIKSMEDNELMNYSDKTLVWSRSYFIGWRI